MCGTYNQIRSKRNMEMRTSSQFETYYIFHLLHGYMSLLLFVTCFEFLRNPLIHLTTNPLTPFDLQICPRFTLQRVFLFPVFI